MHFLSLLLIKAYCCLTVKEGSAAYGTCCGFYYAFQTVVLSIVWNGCD